MESKGAESIIDTPKDKIEMVDYKTYKYLGQGLVNALVKMPYIGTRKEELQTIPGAIPHPSNRPHKGCIFYSRCTNGKAICEKTQPPVYSVTEQHGVKCFFREEGKL